MDKLAINNNVKGVSKRRATLTEKEKVVIRSSNRAKLNTTNGYVKTRKYSAMENVRLSIAKEIAKPHAKEPTQPGREFQEHDPVTTPIWW